MVAVGHLVVYGVGSLNLDSMLGNALGETQFKKLVIIAALTLLTAVGVTCWAVTERVRISDGYTIGKARLRHYETDRLVVTMMYDTEDL